MNPEEVIECPDCRAWVHERDWARHRATHTRRSCSSRHKPGPQWFDGEDRTVTCTRPAGHTGWHHEDTFEWDDEHALTPR